jgi:hypothetical protein
LAVRSVLVRVDAAAEFGVWVPVASPRVLGVPSSLEGSGVVGRLLNWLLKFGRKRDVKEGEGGSGVGGLP